MENPVTDMGFVWECDGNSIEEKNVLEDSLPEGFKYKINKFKIIEKSEIKEEIKFQAEFVVNICDKEEATRFINSIATRNDTDMRPSTVEFKRKGFTSLRYNCSRKVKTSTESQETVPDKKRKVDKQVGKGTGCAAHFSYKMFDCKNEEGVKCFDLQMKIVYDHNHEHWCLELFGSQQRDIVNYLLTHIFLPKPDWYT